MILVPEACWTLDLSRLSCKSLFTWRSISWRQASRASTEGPSSNPVLVTGSGRLSWCAWHYGTKALIEHSNVAIYIYICVCICVWGSIIIYAHDYDELFVQLSTNHAYPYKMSASHGTSTLPRRLQLGVKSRPLA